MLTTIIKYDNFHSDMSNMKAGWMPPSLEGAFNGEKAIWN